MEIARQRCLLHPAREAAARCPSCSRFYCRECVTEHSGRLLCTSCLREKIAAAKGSEKSRRVFTTLRQGAVFALAVFWLWFAFFLAGQFLSRTPTVFHDGTVWRQPR